MKAFKLDNQTVRIVTGSLCSKIDLKWDELSLDEIAHIFENHLIGELVRAKLIKAKKPRMHRGGNHIDLIDDGVGSLEAIKVCDHFSKFPT